MRRRKKSIQWEPLLAVGLLTVFLVWGWGASESSANILTSVTPNNPCDDGTGDWICPAGTAVSFTARLDTAFSIDTTIWRVTELGTGTNYDCDPNTEGVQDCEYSGWHPEFTHTFSEAGTYRVKAIIYSGFPPSSKSVTVTVPDEPFTVNILPVTGCMVLAGDGGVDDAEPNGNGIVCSGGMATNNPLCTEQFQKSQVASLKVVPEPGHVFTGWTVNGAQINASVEPLFLTTMPLLAQTGERITPITGNTADCQANCASIEIVSADITQNHIQIRLEPEGTVGDLTLELRDPDSYVILENQPRTGSEDALNESFNLDNWDEEAIGRYTRLRATWTVNDVEIQDELVFSEGMQLDVLGGYEHTQYQAISEQDFNGNATAACLVIDNQCTYQQITLRSDFLEEVIENTGHGTSIEHGRLQWGTWCANNGYPPPAACAPTGELVRTLVAVDTYIGSCGSPVIPGTTVAVGLDGNDLSPENPDNLRCDERLFIYHPDYPELQVIKTITDRCPDCANERHVDNYVDESADAFTYPDDPMTIRLY